MDFFIIIWSAASPNSKGFAWSTSGGDPSTNRQSCSGVAGLRTAFSYVMSERSTRRKDSRIIGLRGVPAAVVKSLIGHDSEEVHQLYVAVGKDALASAAARLPDLG
jgi:hypothetical protein